MTYADLALLFAAIAASFFWSACFSHLSGDSRSDVALIAGAGVVLTAAAAVTAVV
jgi:hypothetical protein